MQKQDRSPPVIRRPPPDYFSRPVQQRLLLAVGSLMLVVILMWEARKPQNWQWMWGAKTAGYEQVDTRLARAPRQLDPPGTVYANDKASGLPPQLAAGPVVGDVLSRYRSSGWKYVLDSLSREERWGLDEVLQAAGQGAPSTEEPIDSVFTQAAWLRLDGAWDAFLRQAQQEVRSRQSAPASDRAAWLDALSTLRLEWRQDLKPALKARLDRREWTPAAREQLVRLQAIVDRLSWDEVQDNTVWRAADQHAWFRLIDHLLHADAAQLQRHSLGTTSFVQLFRQPNEYRGKLVRIQGRAKMGYRVPAPSNRHGIEHYYVLWIQPSGGQNSPLVVYCLETPDRFPRIAFKDSDGRGTELNEQVVCDAFFFKRWAYRAQDGVNTAPLLLAKAPIWLPPAKAGPSRRLPTPLTTLLSVGVVLCLSIGLAYLAHLASNRPSLAQKRFRHQLPNQVPLPGEPPASPQPSEDPP